MREKIESIPVRRYAFRTSGRGLRRRLAALLLSGPELRRMCSDLKADAIDVLHVQCVSSNAGYAMGRKRSLGLPLVVSLQGS